MANAGAERRLGPLLCWGVVFADIGTSVYYVPGILWGQVGGLAPVFVLMTGVAFVFLAAKYAEISSRYSEGGGVVAVAGDAFGEYVGALGGMLITVDYFLTTAISSVSGVHYLSSVLPSVGPHLILTVTLVLLAFGVLNGIGIRESATVTLTFAVGALAVDLVVIGVVSAQLDAEEWHAVAAEFGRLRGLSATGGLVGFAGAWLAFSGLESISQLSPAMRTPRARTARVGMALVVATILLTSPILTAFSTGLTRVDKRDADYFISAMGGAFGGLALKVAVVVTAAALLLFAANTAIIGGYHVFRALARKRFMPALLARRSPRFGTPHLAIAVAVLVPVGVIQATHGDLAQLGQMYAFGLLGAFTLSSGGLDVVRWREGQRGVRFWVGAATTLVVVVAWSTNIVFKPLATYFGGAVTLVGMAIDVGMRRGWFRRVALPVPYLSRELAEQAAAELPQAGRILTLDEARELVPVYHPRSLLCVRGGENEPMLERAADRLRAAGESAVYVLFVDEVAGLFYPASTSPSEEATDVLSRAAAFLERRGLTAVPLWRIGHSAGGTIARTASDLGVRQVIIGTSRRTPLWKLLRGSVMRELNEQLPAGLVLTIVH